MTESMISEDALRQFFHASLEIDHFRAAGSEKKRQLYQLREVIKELENTVPSDSANSPPEHIEVLLRLQLEQQQSLQETARQRELEKRALHVQFERLQGLLDRIRAYQQLQAKYDELRRRYTSLMNRRALLPDSVQNIDESRIKDMEQNQSLMQELMKIGTELNHLQVLRQYFSHETVQSYASLRRATPAGMLPINEQDLDEYLSDLEKYVQTFLSKLTGQT